MRRRLAQVLSSRAFIAAAALLAIALLLPTLRVGFMMDDYTQPLWLRGGPQATGGPRGAWDLFRFQDADRASFRASVDAGLWPWWSSPDLRLAFLRPLTSLTHALDHRLFPGNAAIMRLQNLIMYGAVVAMAGLIYRRLLGATVACGLAALMFAIDDAHAITTVWISNRNAVLAAALGFGALYLHDRGVRDGDRRARIAAPFVFTAALLAGEAALATLAYLVAHAAWLHEDRLKKRLLAIAPYLAVAAAWSVVYRAAGYGAWGGEFYIDPGKEPARFLGALLMRLPILLHGQMSFPPSDMWLLVPFEEHMTVFPIVIAIAVAGWAVVLFGLRHTRQNGFFATGMLLALVPVCATWPSDRLLLFSGLGAFGLIADLLTAPRELLPQGRRAAVRLAAGFFIALHIALAPVIYAGRGVQIARMMHEPIERVAADLPPYDELRDKTVVIVVAPDVLTPSYALFTKLPSVGPMSERIRQLSVASDGRALLRRTGERSVELTLLNGFFRDAWSQVFRRRDDAMSLGDRVEIKGMTAVVKAYTPDRRRAATIEFELDAPLEDPRFVWLTWKGRHLERMEVPAIGQEVEVPIVDYMTAMGQ